MTQSKEHEQNVIRQIKCPWCLYLINEHKDGHFSEALEGKKIDVEVYSPAPDERLRAEIKSILYPPLPHSHHGPQATYWIEVTWKKEGIEYIVEQLVRLINREKHGD